MGEVVLLSGDLGSGKTTLTQGILHGLGADEFARSPTFVLVNEYVARLPLYHMDLYRLDSFEEMSTVSDLMTTSSATDSASSSGLDKANGYFPVDHLLVSIEVTGDDLRTLTLSSCRKSQVLPT